jgi:hypothetical protein
MNRSLRQIGMTEASDATASPVIITSGHQYRSSIPLIDTAHEYRPSKPNIPAPINGCPCKSLILVVPITMATKPAQLHWRQLQA